MTTFWTWLSIIGLSMTPNLILGPSAAVGLPLAFSNAVFAVIYYAVVLFGFDQVAHF